MEHQSGAVNKNGCVVYGFGVEYQEISIVFHAYGESKTFFETVLLLIWQPPEDIQYLRVHFKQAPFADKVPGFLRLFSLNTIFSSGCPSLTIVNPFMGIDIFHELCTYSITKNN
jgi:hypothetical protein